MMKTDYINYIKANEVCKCNKQWQKCSIAAYRF